MNQKISEQIDITLPITPKMVTDAQGNEKKALTGHLGTHFDVMDKVFPLEYTERKAILFDVSHINGRDIDIADIDTEEIGENMFVAFYSGYIETEGYGGKSYFKDHPQLSNRLIDVLLAKKISILGVDFAGIRRGAEHTPKDQYCADRGVFVIENLCNLQQVLEKNCKFTAHTYPMNYVGMTGIPCRVIAQV